MSQRRGWYDPDVLSAAYGCFDIFVPETAQAPSEDVVLPLREIEAGALLLQDVQSIDGLLIVRANTLISEPLIERLRDFALTIGVHEPILVRVALAATTTPVAP